MQLTKTESESFIKRYEDRYCKPWESLQECSSRLIDHGIVADEEKEYEVWKDFFADLLGKKSSKIYKYRSYWPETVLSKVLNAMRLAYWPKIDSGL